MKKMEELLEEYGLEATKMMSEEHISQMMASIKRVYLNESREILEAELLRMMRYVVQSLKLKNTALFLTHFPMFPKAKQKPMDVFEIIHLETGNMARNSFAMNIKGEEEFQKYVKKIGSEKTERAEFFFPGYRIKKLFEMEEAEQFLKWHVREFLCDYIGHHCESEKLKEVNQRMYSVLIERYDQEALK